MPTIIDELKAGKQIALICDAGTPGICDPSYRLVSRCIEENLPYTFLPGPCSLIQALVSSGLPLEKFQFFGFISRKETVAKNELVQMLQYEGTSACFETPHRIIKTLELIDAMDPKRELAIAREMTKKFEEIVRGTASELIAKWHDGNLRGEIVLLISPSVQETLDWNDLPLQEHVKLLEEKFGVGKQEAIKICAKQRNISKRVVYNTIHQQ